jgi:thioredoxin-like negative regulator of GroEL
MIPLLDQQQFENDIWNSAPAIANKTFIIYFTAPWCGACRRLNLDLLRSQTSSNPNVIWYKCDIDENDYTASYCQIRQIPTFLCIKNKQVVSRITSSVNETVAEWIHQQL